MKYVDTEKLKIDMAKAIDQAQEKATEIRDETINKIEQMKDAVKNPKEKIVRYVRENPEKSILVATGFALVAGFVISMMINKKRN